MNTGLENVHDWRIQTRIDTHSQHTYGESCSASSVIKDMDTDGLLTAV